MLVRKLSYKEWLADYFNYDEDMVVINYDDKDLKQEWKEYYKGL